MNKVIALVILTVFAATSKAQEVADASHAVADTTVCHKPCPAKLTTDRYLAALDSLRQAYVDWKYQGGDTLSNPYLFMLLSSPNYHSEPLTQSENPATGVISKQVEERTHAINNLLAHVYATQPWLIEGNGEALKAAIQTATTTLTDSLVKHEEIANLAPVTTPTPPAVEEKPAETFLGDMNAFHIKVKRPNFWKVLGNFNVQLQQTYISENWYKGGRNNYAANGQFTIEANYNNKKKLAWDNKLEARLGFQTAEEYNVTTFRPNNDLLRLTSKLGVQANKHWFYTLAFQAWTQMMQTRDYRKDGHYAIKSEFMAPFEGVLSLGMDYKLEKKKFKTTVNIAPLALNYKHVSRTHDHLSDGSDWFPNKFGLKTGNHNDWKFGSTLTAVASWAICKQLTWDGRLYFFTDYKQHGVKSVDDTDTNFGATVEFENTFTLKINKYFSTRVFLYPRFDTMVPKMVKKDKDDNQIGYHSYFQFKEFLSVGLDVSF